MPTSFVPPKPDPILAKDLFPDIDSEIDDRINYSELKIKNWIIVGILANLVTLVGAAIPVVFYLGQLTSTASQALATIQQQQTQLAEMNKWRNERVLWETAAEQWMISQGYKPPNRRGEN